MVMKMNEKLVAMAVATSMVVPTIMPIMAEEDTKSTTAKYTVQQSYEWSIHGDIEFKDDSTNPTGTVSVTKNVIPDGKKLKITVKGNGGGAGDTAVDDGFKVSNGENHYLTYEVTKTNAATNATVSSGDSVLEVAAGTNTGSQELTFTLNDVSGDNAAKVSGTYEGKVIYTASVVDSTD